MKTRSWNNLISEALRMMAYNLNVHLAGRLINRSQYIDPAKSVGQAYGVSVMVQRHVMQEHVRRGKRS